MKTIFTENLKEITYENFDEFRHDNELSIDVVGDMM